MTFLLDFGSTATDPRLLVIQGNWPSSYKTKGFSLGLILLSKSCLYFINMLQLKKLKKESKMKKKNPKISREKTNEPILQILHT